jgi:hypothetical protein
MNRCHFAFDGDPCGAAPLFLLRTAVATRGACPTHLGTLADCLLFDPRVRLEVARLGAASTARELGRGGRR